MARAGMAGMPSLEQLLLVALGLSCFYPGSSTRSCPPSWATLVWDVPPLELEEKGSAFQDIITPELLYWGIPALCLLLLLVFLGRKVRNCCKKKPGRKDGCCCKTFKLLSQLKENPDLLKRYVRHLQKCRASSVEVFQREEQENPGKLQEGDDKFGSLSTNSKL